MERELHIVPVRGLRHRRLLHYWMFRPAFGCKPNLKHRNNNKVNARLNMGAWRAKLRSVSIGTHPRHEKDYQIKANNYFLKTSGGYYAG